MNMEKIYDLIIIGAGPAGLSASIYASRYKLDSLLNNSAFAQNHPNDSGMISS